jgi:hypothetical protein
MTRRGMDWRRARLHGRPSLDFRREFEFEDRATKWLAKAENRQREPQQRSQQQSLTQTSSEAA